MAKVRFYGDIQRFGTEFELKVSTAAEAFSGLFAQLKGFKAHINQHYYRIKIAGKEYNKDTLSDGMQTKLKANSVIHVIPVLAGGNGAAQMIAGAAIIVASVVSYQWEFIGYGTAVMMGAAGAAMMIGGAIQLNMKPPAMDTGKDAEKKTNTSFSNLTNLTPQGRPVPLLLGEMIHSVVLISQGTEVFAPEE